MRDVNISFIFFILISIATLSVSATIIEGSNVEYAGKELRFFMYSDPVTKNKIPAFSLKIDANGNFKEEVPVSNTTYVFCDFGIYRGMLFIEPGNNIHLLLPPLRERSFADKKNPYFEPVKFWFSTASKDHLNDKVSVFDTKLNQLTDKYFNQLYFRQSESAYDSLIADPGLQYNDASETFRIHKQLKLKSIEIDVFRMDPSEVSKLLSTVSPAFWKHPAFIEIFEKIFGNKLSFETKSAQTNNLNEAVSTANIGFIIDYIKENYLLTGPVVKLALLKMLHDGFYSGDFPEKAILKMLSSDILAGNSDKNIQKISQNILKKLKHLQSGTMAPVICLKNTDGQQVCTNENNSKFKYLIFADTEMIISREHLKYLTKIDEQFSQHLEIFIILKKTGLIEMKMFLNKQQIPGIHLIDKESRYIEEYRVRSFPSCFLLDSKHKVVIQQVKAPLDGFEQQFDAFLERELFNKEQN